MKLNRVLNLVNSFMESVTPGDQENNRQQIMDVRAKKMASTGNGVVLFRKGEKDQEQVLRVEIKFKNRSREITYNL